MVFTVGGFTLDDTVLPYGEIRWSAPGGNALYSAIGAHIWSEEVGIVALVGQDYPKAHLDRLAQAGFNLDGVRRIDHPSFHVWILHEGNGRRQIVYRLDSGDNQHLDPEPEDVPAEYRKSAVAAHICPILGSSQAALQRALIGNGLSVYLDLIQIQGQIDVNEGHDIERWPDLTALLPSIEEVQAIWGNLPLNQLLDEFREVAPSIAAVKMGSRGALVMHGAETYHVPAFPVDVLDATGAGDTFCGGFMAGMESAGDPIEAAIRGTVSASFAIEDFGALHVLDADLAEAEQRAQWVRNRVRPLEQSETI